MNPSQIEYLDLQLRRQRRHGRLADEAARRWQQRAADIDDLAARAGWDDLRRRQARDRDQVLRDAAADWDWHTRHAQRIATSMLAELAMHHLGRRCTP